MEQMMLLKNLVKNIPDIDVRGDINIPIKGICSNSSCVAPGDLFVAKKGLSTNGAQYIPHAVDGGAAAILTDLYDPNFKHVAQLITPDVQHVESLLAYKFYGFPGQHLFMVGVTGTNGKTTTAYLIKYLFDKLRGPCGLIGTVEYLTGSRSVPATHTTPDVTANHQLLHQMVVNQCQSAVMEVSSHAFTQGRVSQIDFDVAVFTNLSQEHLDYHQTMENYALAKSTLFREMTSLQKDDQRCKAAVVNIDDPYTITMLKDCKVKPFTYGIESEADLVASDIVYQGNETCFSVRYVEKNYSCRIPLVGRYNIYNTLAAMGVALTQGFTIEQVIEVITTFSPVPGRMELVENPLGLRIIVDFAHTGDALENALSCVREMQPERVITVFGCGGDRDRGKRSIMGRVSGKLSDISIVTSDNPRTEEPMAIICEIIEGFSEGQEYVVEVDRRKAIMKAIELATPHDIVLIAGKGHETTQIVSHRRLEFDDRQVAKECCVTVYQSCSV
jgi:UDP-N-acetylmuramoyl-L-alanyl-D-glutamate--2,6-diaminopimelate ligase